MSSGKKFVVFTVTGDQGSSVAKYLVKEGYKVVGLTRNPESEKAKAVAELGVEVVKADLDDSSSYASALEGAYGTYVNADFWQRYFTNGLDNHEAGEYEAGQAKAAIEAATKAGVTHIIYSSLDNAEVAPHMSYKAKVTLWANEHKYPVTSLYTSHYMANLYKLGLLKKEDDGTFTLNIPAPDDTPIPNFAVEQTGGWVAAILKDPKKYIGQRVDACGEETTLGEWAATLSEVSGKKVKTLGIPGGEFFLDGTEIKKMVPAEEIYLNYLAFYQKLCTRDLAASKQVYPDAWDTKTWIQNTPAIKGIFGI